MVDVNARLILRFNPRLPLPGGDAMAGVVIALRVNVSIHASRCREAMR